jgi:hypothetical protein
MQFTHGVDAACNFYRDQGTRCGRRCDAGIRSTYRCHERFSTLLSYFVRRHLVPIERPATASDWHPQPERIYMTNPVGQAFTVIGLAAHLGRGFGRVAADAVVGGRLGLPRTVEDIDAAVLSNILGTTVRSVRVLGSDAGTSSRARLVLTGKMYPSRCSSRSPQRPPLPA